MLIRHTVCRFLEERGYNVESATNGEEALPIVHRIRPDIIITDMQMPKMSGTEFITALKARPETAEIPIVIVAGKNSGSTAKEQRANFAIFKDIDIEAQLTKALEALLESRGTKVKAAVKGIRQLCQLSALLRVLWGFKFCELQFQLITATPSPLPLRNPWQQNPPPEILDMPQLRSWLRCRWKAGGREIHGQAFHRGVLLKALAQLIVRSHAPGDE